jgi:hypothetical protein
MYCTMAYDRENALAATCTTHGLKIHIQSPCQRVQGPLLFCQAGGQLINCPDIYGKITSLAESQTAGGTPTIWIQAVVTQTSSYSCASCICVDVDLHVKCVTVVAVAGNTMKAPARLEPWNTPQQHACIRVTVNEMLAAPQRAPSSSEV